MESSAPDAFKQMYVDATPDDVVIVLSPVGLPGRALRNPFWERTQRKDYPKIPKCISCLKQCHKEYCIMDELVMCQRGDVEQGLVFSGSAAARVHDVPTVADLMARLVAEYDEAQRGAGMRRVAVTGLGVVTPTGVGCDAMWDSLSNGRSGISPIEHFDASEYTTRFAGYIKEFDPSRRDRPQRGAAHVAFSAVRHGRG